MKAFAVAVLLVLAARCGPDPTTPIIDQGLPPATYETPVTVDLPAVVPDPPFVADAAGVPTADVPAEIVPVEVVIVPGPAGTAVAGRCTQYEDLLIWFAPPGGWSIEQMSAYMDRETKCLPWLRSTTSDSGLLQVNDVNLPFLRQVLGQWVDRWTLLDPVQNVHAASALCTYWRNAGKSCYRPWGGKG